MKLTIDIDLNNDSREQISQVANLLNNITNAARRPTSTQPEVVQNTGSTGPVPTLQPGDSAVTGADVAVEQTEDKSAPVVVKRGPGRPPKVKEEAAAQEGKSPAVSAETQPPSGSPSEVPAGGASAAAPTLDDVRAALQGFTGSKGVPAGIELLKEFAAARISELKAEQFAAFIEKCGV